MSLPPRVGSTPPRMRARWLLSVTSPQDRSLGSCWPSNRQPRLPAPPESPPRRARQRLGSYLYSAPSSLQGPHDPASAMSRARPSSEDSVERVHPEHDRVDGLGAPRRLVTAGLGEPPRSKTGPSASGGSPATGDSRAVGSPLKSKPSPPLKASLQSGFQLHYVQSEPLAYHETRRTRCTLLP